MACKRLCQRQAWGSNDFVCLPVEAHFREGPGRFITPETLAAPSMAALDEQLRRSLCLCH
jgi:hypothetical protein